MPGTITHTEDSLNATCFCQSNPGWHTFAKDRRTESAIARAVEFGSIEANEFHQMRNVETPANDPRLLRAQVNAVINFKSQDAL